MAFVIVRTTDKDKTAMRRRMLLPGVTHAQAIANLEKELYDYKEHGKNDEQGQWWARNGSGEQFTFWIEGE